MTLLKRVFANAVTIVLEFFFIWYLCELSNRPLLMAMGSDKIFPNNKAFGVGMGKK